MRYRVFEPAGVEGRSDGARFVRDGFSVFALLLPALWLLRHGLFLAAIAAFLVDVLFGILAQQQGFGMAGAVLPLLLGLAIALEGPTLRARRLAAKGFRESAVVNAGSEREAELLYFMSEGDPETSLPPALPVLVAKPMSRSPFTSVRSRPGQTLFDLPGR